MEENKLKAVEQPRDRVVLVGLSSPVLKADSADEESMDELAALVETAGAVSVATVLQNLPSPNPRSFIGEGKVAEIKELSARPRRRWRSSTTTCRPRRCVC